jgi:hypothetical protein
MEQIEGTIDNREWRMENGKERIFTDPSCLFRDSPNHNTASDGLTKIPHQQRTVLRTTYCSLSGMV